MQSCDNRVGAYEDYIHLSYHSSLSRSGSCKEKKMLPRASGPSGQFSKKLHLKKIWNFSKLSQPIFFRSLNLFFGKVDCQVRHASILSFEIRVIRCPYKHKYM